VDKLLELKLTATGGRKKDHLLKVEGSQLWFKVDAIREAFFGHGQRAVDEVLVEKLMEKGFFAWDAAHPVQFVVSVDAQGDVVFQDNVPVVYILDGEHRTTIAHIKKFPWITVVVSGTVGFVTYAWSRF
jgi:hypothetical protein